MTCQQLLFLHWPLHIIVAPKCGKVQVATVTLRFICINHLSAQKKHEHPAFRRPRTNLLLALFNTVGNARCVTGNAWSPGPLEDLCQGLRYSLLLAQSQESLQATSSQDGPIRTPSPTMASDATPISCMALDDFLERRSLVFVFRSELTSDRSHGPRHPVLIITLAFLRVSNETA